MISQSVWLKCGPEAAFALFAARIGEWWPGGHRPSREASSVVRLEQSGRFWETTVDGREFEMGRVLEWVDGERLCLAFYLGTGADQPTDVVIRFVAEGEGTRVTVEHGPGGVALAMWELRAPRFEENWGIVLRLVTGVLR